MIEISNKIKNDKYYTPPELAKYAVDKTKEIIGEKNISEYLEPSAGSGVFLDYLDKPYLAYDIEPEDNMNRITKQDYLELDLEHKKGRCIIGNPPFGRANSMLKKFYKKSVELGDYISFIMPISQFKNNNELYDFDLVYSEDLKIQDYSTRKIHCCLNIFKKPKNKKSKPRHKYKDIEIIGWRKAKDIECDFYICCYGSSVGKFVPQDSDLVNINGIIIHNEELRDEIICAFKSAKWTEEYPMVSSPNLLQWQMYKYIKKHIPGLE